MLDFIKISVKLVAMAKVFKVGGAVRDKFLGKKPSDVDFAVEAPSFQEMEAAILAMGGEIFERKPTFFTIRARIKGLTGGADFVLCRQEGAYRDGRHPDNVEVGDIWKDLARRDFTINAMAIDENDILLDPFGGRVDIQNKIIRCVGNPNERMAEDSLRAIRALRFAVTLGFEIEPETWRAVASVTNWQAVSTDRIWQELNKMFSVNCWESLNMLSQFPNIFEEVVERGIVLLPKMPKA